jgi:hypothetical protein
MANYTKKTWWVEHTNFVALKRTIGRCAHYTDENYHNTALVSMIKFFRKMEDVKENQETLDGLLCVMENIKKQHKKLGSMPYDLIVVRSEVRTRFHDYLQKNFEKNIINMVLSAF